MLYDFTFNKDDNIHKSEALKSEGRTNEHEYEIVHKFLEKKPQILIIK